MKEYLIYTQKTRKNIHMINLWPTELQDIAATFFSAFGLARLIRVIQDEWVQVAIARMENISDLKAIAVTDATNPIQRFRQLACWDGAIHAEIVR